MAPRRRRHSVVVAPLSLLTLIVAAACGGAVDNGDLFKKNQGNTTSGGTPTATPTATSSPPSVPTVLPPVPEPKPDPQCAVSFTTDVMQVLSQTGCGNVQCHGAKLNEPAIDPTSPSLTYKAITAYTMSTGEPYVDVGNTDPGASGMFCNFRGACGPRMPIGGKLNSNQLKVMDAWLACGAPFN